MEIEALVAAVRASPKDSGTLRLIVARRPDGGHLTPERALIEEGKGLAGDRWRLKPGDPRTQVSLINSRLLEAVAGPEGLSLAGDNLVVDLDLSREDLPVGARLLVGEALLELTDYPHTGCSKFERRFGKDARRLVDSPEGQALRLRGVYARVLRGGEVRVGDPVRRAEP